MPKRQTLLLILLAALLAACATATPAAPATATPLAGAADLAADATLGPAVPALATPVAGWVKVITSSQIKAVLLRSQPEPKSAVAGRALPGESGELLGQDASGTWLLVTIRQQTGWLPVELLEITFEQ